jgi:hypothetical protein
MSDEELALVLHGIRQNRRTPAQAPKKAETKTASTTTTKKSSDNLAALLAAAKSDPGIKAKLLEQLAALHGGKG